MRDLYEKGVAVPKWTLDQAVGLVRSLHEEVVKNGCTLALGGSCLHRGFSEKDVDIIIHPLECKETALSDFDFYAVKDCLTELGLTYIRDAHIAEYSERNVEIWYNKEGKRIDIFFMRA